MKSIRYTRYTGEDFGLTAEDLMKALADFFLNSGFDNPLACASASSTRIRWKI